MTKLLLIGLGGALGAVLRFALSTAVQGTSGGWVPVGTLAVNTLGSFAMGFLGGALAAHAVQLPETWRLALTVGFLGGFTTFSAYAWETIALAGDGLRGEAFANVLLANACALGALWLGFVLAERLLGA